MAHKWKSRDDAAEFIIKEHGPKDHPQHTIELSTTYNADFCGGGGMSGALMRQLPAGAAYFDKENGRVWRLLPQWLGLAEQIALKHFKFVYRTEGDTTTELRSQSSITEGRLF